MGNPSSSQRALIYLAIGVALIGILWLADPFKWAGQMRPEEIRKDQQFQEMSEHMSEYSAHMREARRLLKEGSEEENK